MDLRSPERDDAAPSDKCSLTGGEGVRNIKGDAVVLGFSVGVRVPAEGIAATLGAAGVRGNEDGTPSQF